MPRKSNKKKNEPPKDLHSGKHLKPINFNIKITPKIVTLELKSKPYLNGKTVLHFHMPISKKLPPFVVGSLPLQAEEEESIDVDKAVDRMTRARTYIVNNLQGAMRAAVQGLIKEAIIQQLYSPDEIDKGLETSLDRAAFDRNNNELSKRFDEITKELTVAGLSGEEMERERRKRVHEFMRPRWFQEWVGIYALGVQTRLQGGARWIILDKWWGIEAKITNFPFYLVHEKWKRARKTHSPMHPDSSTFEEKKQAVIAECGPLPDDLLEALFEWDEKAGDYKWEPVLVACVHAARILNYKDASIHEADTLYKRFFSKLLLRKRPSSEEAKRAEEKFERRFGRWKL